MWIDQLGIRASLGWMTKIGLYQEWSSTTIKQQISGLEDLPSCRVPQLGVVKLSKILRQIKLDPGLIPLQLKHFQYIFILLTIGWSISILGFIAECIIYKIKWRRQERWNLIYWQIKTPIVDFVINLDFNLSTFKIRDHRKQQT